MKRERRREEEEEEEEGEERYGNQGFVWRCMDFYDFV